MNDPVDLFEYASLRGVKVRCKVCGRTGYRDAPWQEACRKGHPYECNKCNRAFATRQAIAAHRRRVHGDPEKIRDADQRRAEGVRAYWARVRHERGLDI